MSPCIPTDLMRCLLRIPPEKGKFLEACDVETNVLDEYHVRLRLQDQLLVVEGLRREDVKSKRHVSALPGAGFPSQMGSTRVLM